MKLQTGLISALGALLFSFTAFTQSSLVDIAKPYTGEYECKIARLGGKDLLTEFRSICLDLKAEGEYELRYRLKNGDKGKDTGKYEYDQEKQTLRLTQGKIGEWKRDIPLQKGNIMLTCPLGNQILYIQFTHK